MTKGMELPSLRLGYYRLRWYLVHGPNVIGLSARPLPTLHLFPLLNPFFSHLQTNFRTIPSWLHISCPHQGQNTGISFHLLNRYCEIQLMSGRLHCQISPFISHRVHPYVIIPVLHLLKYRHLYHQAILNSFLHLRPLVAAFLPRLAPHHRHLTFHILPICHHRHYRCFHHSCLQTCPSLRLRVHQYLLLLNFVQVLLVMPHNHLTFVRRRRNMPCSHQRWLRRW